MSLYSDIALVLTEESLPNLATLAADDPAPGEAVLVAGHPKGGVLRVREGQVLGYLPADAYGPGNIGNVIQLDAEVAPGSSGGPIFNMSGEVVAVMFAVDLNEGFAVALPVSTLNLLLEQVASGTHWLAESEC